MRRIIYCWTVLAVLSVLFLCSCSVYENRAECPAWIMLDFSRCPSPDMQVSVKLSDAVDKSYSEILSLAEQGNTKAYEVNRGEITYIVGVGLDYDHIEGSVYTIPEGDEMAFWYASLRKPTLTEDIMPETVPFDKQYCNLLVSTIEDMSSLYGNVEFSVSSTTGGVDYISLEPVAGTFSVRKYISKDGKMSVCLPRQGFGDLKLSLIMDGVVLREYDLSALLDEKGYDWKAVSLADATVRISVSSLDCTVSIGEWEDGGNIEGDR